ncbi:CDP-diacylglycerol--glycerol-3-phosphate 3-phosphatidyltransferase [Bifidobacterium subtile]|jgi:CDP-diacylglycerol--glycerol-3-phosphate 3-phosphatidyltransferase|uniref:CDP-diacylglycerol--glycerol-3-phosphate 3-phosphatidyltransferase n=1 Tax=Bifidobacterium subtile TaxID=77635 RepID=A0A087DU40_9BIFI|nr:CDP-diacylglycerol--glycerol-3-phosphate 3-phosphatidyltransferase [Bifidobacterium subtile]KFI99040.1 CDP-diacylglycerol--glycerol-3-phosphate 3-phosphatidyltransferase [Bifidobacterium subtile]MCI1222578.1 CDP-diacylglycerol--glycerol-3-phosphate 3-phosphatidyltransferase [Bifidobacterium subtile]MCI1240920.1 CDP-diacylglycerol--glycerol-3-phosphate 3-phosphatidyltransferase [Bifidobacterium subtile]MCI1258203.1 CDP-diacylglycerol--glycerol-3-phosphate 3-phosphatidyltransferase [Bifidobact
MQTRDEHKTSLWDGWNSPPNLVTYSRIVLVLVFLWADIAAGPWGAQNLPLRWAAAILFVVAASTDKLDGWMARKYDQVTELGKLMDPIADKLLILATLIVASAFGEVFWWVTILFLIRELGITVMRFFVIDSGGKVIAASQAGKYKTLTECVGLGMLLTPLWSLAPAGETPTWVSVYNGVTQAIIYIALALCLYSGGEYLVNTFGGRRAAPPTGGDQSA